MYSLDQLSFSGHDLVRPECILATAAGNLYVSDFRGGVTQIHPDGRQTFYGGTDVVGIGSLKPNGIALLPDGSFLAAHLGDRQGGIFHISRNHKITPFVTEADGEPLPPSNFIYLDHQQRLWLTVSTRLQPRAAAYRSDVKDGFIALIETDQSGQHKARIVADGIGYTNELYIPPNGSHLYVNATFSREMLRFEITPHNDLVNPEVVAAFGKGIYPDGLTMDRHGYLWVTSIVSNTVIRINPYDGSQRIVLEDKDDSHIDWVESAYKQHAMGRPHLDNAQGQALKNISSLAFGGPELTQLYMGCLLGDSIASCEGHVVGLAPAHWEFDGGG